MAYISSEMNARLQQPHEIRHSVVKLSVLTIILLATTLVALFFANRIHQAAPAGAPVDKGVWALLVVAAAGAFFFCLRALPKWLVLGSPVLTISRDGLLFRGKPLMRWDDIVENQWVSLGGLGITTGAKLHVETAEQRVSREAITFNCSSAEYMRLCELYEEAGRQAQG